MRIIGRSPSVTGLYSSAVFVGWCSHGLDTQSINAIGSSVAALVGLIYHCQSFGKEGDFSMMRRYSIPTSGWAMSLITIGVNYFSRWFLAIIYVLQGVFLYLWKGCRNQSGSNDLWDHLLCYFV